MLLFTKRSEDKQSKIYEEEKDDTYDKKTVRKRRKRRKPQKRKKGKKRRKRKKRREQKRNTYLYPRPQGGLIGRYKRAGR